eukprot:3941013-Rhodomonas_salina.3
MELERSEYHSVTLLPAHPWLSSPARHARTAAINRSFPARNSSAVSINRSTASTRIGGSRQPASFRQQGSI